MTNSIQNLSVKSTAWFRPLPGRSLRENENILVLSWHKFQTIVTLQSDQFGMCLLMKAIFWSDKLCMSTLVWKGVHILAAILRSTIRCTYCIATNFHQDYTFAWTSDVLSQLSCCGQSIYILLFDGRLALTNRNQAFYEGLASNHMTRAVQYQLIFWQISDFILFELF